MRAPAPFVLSLSKYGRVLSRTGRNPFTLSGRERDRVPPFALSGRERDRLPPLALSGSERDRVPPFTLSGSERDRLPPFALSGSERDRLPPFALSGSERDRLPPFALSVGRAAAVVEARLALLALSFLIAGCTADFTPRSVLDDLRVIALVTSPLEAGPSEDVGVSAATIWPRGGAKQEERWTFCPVSVGASAGYACAVPQCETQLATTGGAVTFNPGDLTRACAAQFAGQGQVPVDLPDQLVTLVRYVATFTDPAGGVQTREAVQRLTLYTKTDPATRNHAPIITGVQIGGRDVLGGAIPPTLALGQGLEIRVLVDPTSAERYVDASGSTLQESIVVSYYTTAGRFDYDRASGPDARVNLDHESIPAAVNEALVYVVARDLRGGEAVAGPFRVAVTH